MWHRYFTKVLKNDFTQAQKETPTLTLRGYSKLINTPAGMVSELLNGKRTIGFYTALKILKNLNSGEDAVSMLENLYEQSRSPAKPILLSAHAVELILNPLYYRIICAFEILPQPTTQKEICKFLDIDLKGIPAIIDSLEKFKIIEIKNGRIRWSGKHVITAENLTSPRIQAFHRETLRQAAEDLRLPIEEREYTSVTFAGDSKLISEAKEQIRKFRESLPQSMQLSKANRIYEISIQLRPVSKTYSPKDSNKRMSL